MTRFGWMVAAAGCVILAGIFGFFIWHHLRTETQESVSTQATTTPNVNPATLSIYTSGEYGLSLFYPSDADLTDAYSSTTLANIPWRTGKTNGVPIVRIEKGTEEVRVGMSTTTSEVKGCTQSGSAEQSEGSFMVGSTTWHKFTFQKIGTDDEQAVTSFRTVHASSCYALELFQPLSGVGTSSSYTLGDTITSVSFAD